ncbi:MAG TPA: alpha/beta hydrolase [Solirubrobacterales bacterium]|jgi:acetyl esterase|nr:alpha/beta hydrolase [Solirubrobacterales bacterium]
MGELPRLPAPIEHRILKWACGLSPRTSRLLFGRPPTIDGQTLSTETHALLTLARLSGSNGFFAGRSVEGARAASRYEARVTGRPRPIRMTAVRKFEIPGPIGPIPARLYEPPSPTPDPAAPLLVYYHGGGWVIGDLDMYDDLSRLIAAASGAMVLSVDYRLAPEHPFPQPLEDAFAAFEWAAASAARLGADPARIGVGGDSAGGNMAAVVSRMAVEGGGARPAMQLLFYPVTDAADDTRSRELFADGFILTKADMDKFEAAYLPPGADATDQRISILRCPDLNGLPPAYVATAGFDPLRDEGEAYALRMRECGVRVALRRHSGLIHTFVNQTAVNRTALAAVLEACGALRLGLAPASS